MKGKVSKKALREEKRNSMASQYSMIDREKQRKVEDAKQKEAEQHKSPASEQVSFPVPNAGSTDQIETMLRTAALKNRLDSEAEKSEKKPSLAKAAGLKSTLVISDGELLMTSFGAGSQAIAEKRITDEGIEAISEVPAFDVQALNNQFQISGRLVHDAKTDNPLATSKRIGQDQIGCRDQLERLFFGRNFEDNVHIQIAHQILDVDKILAIHINNIIYEINNLMRKEDAVDLFEKLGFENTYEKFVAKTNNVTEAFAALLRSPQLAYFGDILYDAALSKKLKKEKNQQRKAILLQQEDAKHREAYNLLSVLGQVRQSMAHFNPMIYAMDPQFDSLYAKKANHFDPMQRLASRAALDQLYSARVSELNTNFLNHAKVDLQILFAVDKAVLPEDKKRIVRDYYDFVVRKEYKNQGFSIKLLREMMLAAPAASMLLGQSYDSMRARLYRSFDFIVFKHYRDHEQEIEQIVVQLRACRNEKEKQAIYRAEAARVWPLVGPTIMNDLLPWMDGNKLAAASKTGPDDMVNFDMIQDIAINTDVASFTKIIYLMTRFLDGKEINDLLTTLINKFENIAGFLDILREKKIPCGFAQGYNMFGRSARIAKELRAVNSFARMSEDAPEAKRILFIEAAKVLGYPGDEETLGKYIDDMLTAQGEFVARGKGFRNFIANNVIESDRFKYLVRYGNVNQIRLLANNENVLAFVLKDIPDTQIIRYYNSCTGAACDCCTPDMRHSLAKMMTGISFEQFATVKQKNDAAPAEKADKVRKQAVIRLYLTVLYLLVKNLVYVNSRYFLAFHSVERDSIIYDQERFTPANIKDHYTDFAMERIENGAFNQRVSKYLRQNMANANSWATRTFRNNVEHLNAVRLAGRYIADVRGFTSYFELYHYLMQRRLMEVYAADKAEIDARLAGGEMREKYAWFPMADEKVLTYFAMVDRYHTYCKDMVKALNVPFAYNLARYKNLSINELFDRNHYLEHKGRTEALVVEGAVEDSNEN